MSWKESAASQRAEFIRLTQEAGQEFKEACEVFGISRKTGYKWLKRWRAEGDAGLVDQSRRPKMSPVKSGEKVEARVLELRARHPRWGGRKLRRRLLDIGDIEVPSASTITAILGRNGLLSEEDGAGQPRAYQRFEHAAANDLWQMDFKGHIGMSGGGRCHPLTVLDDHSRYSIGLRACANEQAATVISELTMMFRQYGLPVRMLMDNGSPWGDEGGQPWTIVTSWLVRLGIRISHIRPRHPQTQGKDERFHRTLKAEVLSRQDFVNLAACQQMFDPWREIYNRERPHESLKLNVPQSRYTPSTRRYPEVLPAVEYSSDKRVRKVRTDYLISFQGHRIRIGKAFIGECVGVCASVVEGIYEVYYCQQQIGWIDFRTVEKGSSGTLSLSRKIES